MAPAPVCHHRAGLTWYRTLPWHRRYRGAKIQLLDLPGIIEGAKDGKGRGRQVGH